MLRSKFLGSALVLILGVNLSAWALSVGTSPSQGEAQGETIAPISSQAIDTKALAASAAASADATSSNATSTQTMTPSQSPTNITLVQD